ncbi:MAG: type II toxin-antitoxin system RelB/DinJ family antitoxin [Clostridiales bacterium]|nr:type II toxin-antitoxin system RelB/DinJ family antitoxin [Clostridiales bacterium]
MNVRIDENVKKNFDEFCAEVGMNASVAINMFVRAVLRSRSIPFEITNATNDENEKILAETLRLTLLERIKEAAETDYWIDHRTVIDDARKIIAAEK